MTYHKVKLVTKDGGLGMSLCMAVQRKICVRCFETVNIEEFTDGWINHAKNSSYILRFRFMMYDLSSGVAENFNFVLDHSLLWKL